MRFYTDEDVPLEVEGLGARAGLDIVSAQTAGMRGRQDIEQLLFATSQGRVILTNNARDFMALSRRCADESTPHAGVLCSSPQIEPRHAARAVAALVLLAEENPDGLPLYYTAYLRW